MNIDNIRKLAGLSESLQFNPKNFTATREAEQAYDKLSNDIEQMLKQVANQLDMSPGQVLHNVMYRLALMKDY